jgi:hypothetical protein
MIVFIILIVIIFLLLKTISKPPCLVEVKKRYSILREYCKNGNDVPKKFKILQKQILISGYSKTRGPLGWNSNKGEEIGICIDGTPNQAFHILIHELTHTTVDEYSHSEDFWKNFKELCILCEKIKIYEPINHQAKFCGKYIKD